MESRLSLEACWVRGIPICSSACRQTHANTEDDSVYESGTIPNWSDPKTSSWSNRTFDFAAHITFPEGKLLSVSKKLFFFSPVTSSLHRVLICWAYLPHRTEQNHQYVRARINKAIDKLGGGEEGGVWRDQYYTGFIVPSMLRAKDELRQWQTDHSGAPRQAWRWCSHWQLVQSGWILSGCGWAESGVLCFGTGPKRWKMGILTGVQLWREAGTGSPPLNCNLDLT